MKNKSYLKTSIPNSDISGVADVSISFGFPSMYGLLTPVIIVMTLTFPVKSLLILAPMITCASGLRFSATRCPMLLNSSSFMSLPPVMWISAPFASL